MKVIAPCQLSRQVLFLLCMGFAVQTSAQFECFTTEGLPPAQNLGIACGTSINYAPIIPEHTPIKTIRIAIHSFLKNDWTGNFDDTQADRAYLDAVILASNGRLEHLGVLNIGSTPYIEDSRVRIHLEEVYYHPHTMDWAYTDASVVFNTYVINDADGYGFTNDDKYNVHHILLNGDPNATVGGQIPSNDFGDQGYITFNGWYTHYQQYGSSSAGWGIPGNFIHEVMHSCDLHHNFIGECNDGCSDNDPCAQMGASTNYMDKYPGGFNSSNPDPGLSECQLGRVHYCLSGNVGTLHRTVLEDHCTNDPTAAMHITGTHTWTASKKLRGDLIIEPGASLTITCRVHFPYGAKLIVKPNAKLVVEEGHLTNECGDFWNGIEVHGNSLEHQYPYTQPEHQGMVVLRGGAVIEHAREGVQLWEPGNFNSTGGVLIAEDATYLNCRRAVAGMKYEGFAPHDSSIRWKNRTSFNRVRFAVDENYRGGTDFDTHLSLWGMEGINFVQCTWENLQPDMMESADLGHGITSGASSFRIRAGCSTIVNIGEPCPTANVLESVFRGLDHAIHAENGELQSFSVDQTLFENNVCGVYTNNVDWFEVTRNTFVLGERYVTMNHPSEVNWDELHRAVFAHESHGFTIEDNVLSMFDPPAVFAEGIVVGYNRDFNDEIRRNTATNLENAFVGEGICSDVDNGGVGFIGLQHLCNTNNQNTFNLVDRKVITANPTEQAKHTMRLNQGTYNKPAGNQFDQDQGLPAESDFKRTSENGVLKYRYGGLGFVDPVDYTPVRVDPYPATIWPLGVCDPRSYRNGIRLGDAAKTLLTNDLAAHKLAYGNLRYAYNALLDGGSTDAVVAEISSAWPQDAWDLRAYLLDKSPFLSVESLREMIEENVLPQAMALEVCLANPEGTAQEDFTTWLLNEASWPMPAYMVEQIRASWDQNTFRAEIEVQLAEEHQAMTYAAKELMFDLRSDTLLVQQDSILLLVQQLPTWSARFDEALLCMERREYNNARDVLDALDGPFRLRNGMEDERDRMHDLLDLLETANTDGRSEAELDSAEVTALSALVLDAYDQPAAWGQNILCFHYGICRAPLTGGDGIERSMLVSKPAPEGELAKPSLRAKPNPATSWTTFEYQLPGYKGNAYILIQDLHGKELDRFQITPPLGQHLWDTRHIPAGTYLAELWTDGSALSHILVIVQP